MQNTEIQELFKIHAPSLRFEVSPTREVLDVPTNTLIFIAEVGLAAFPFLWKIFLLWTERYANGKVTIKFKLQNGKEVAIEYAKLTAEEVKEKVAKIQEEQGDQLASPIILNFH